MKENKNKFNISFVTKKKIGNAVKRNKIKRRLRNIVNDAIKNLLENKKSWSETPWEKRCEIFLKAADLISKDYRAKITATKSKYNLIFE